MQIVSGLFCGFKTCNEPFTSLYSKYNWKEPMRIVIQVMYISLNTNQILIRSIVLILMAMVILLVTDAIIKTVPY